MRDSSAWRNIELKPSGRRGEENIPEPWARNRRGKRITTVGQKSLADNLRQCSGRHGKDIEGGKGRKREAGTSAGITIVCGGEKRKETVKGNPLR